MLSRKSLQSVLVAVRLLVECEWNLQSKLDFTSEQLQQTRRLLHALAAAQDLAKCRLKQMIADLIGSSNDSSDCDTATFLCKVTTLKLNLTC